jgi:hypothetical protein
MSIAWTTALIVILLLPGLFFFIGLATFERLSREIVRSSAISEIGLAFVVAIAIHLVAVAILSAFKFRFSEFVEPLFEFSRLNTDIFIQRAADRLVPILVYILVTAAVGGGLGGLVARGIMAGPLRFLATHKWIYDVIDSNRKGGVITVYVMTTVSQDNKILMYRGRLQEFFLGPDGKLSYVVLKNCARYYMNFEDKFPLTSEQLNLFGSKQDGRPKAMWDYLVIEGTNIANILFDPSPEIKQTKEGELALEDEIKKITEAVRQQAAQELKGMEARAKAAREGQNS